MAWAYKILARGGKLLTTGGKAVVLTDANRGAIADCCCQQEECTAATECVELLTPPPQITAIATHVPKAHCDAFGGSDPQAGEAIPTEWETVTWRLTLIADEDHPNGPNDLWEYVDQRDGPGCEVGPGGENPRNTICEQWLANIYITPNTIFEFGPGGGYHMRTKFDAQGEQEWYCETDLMWAKCCGSYIPETGDCIGAGHYAPKSGAIITMDGECTPPRGWTTYYCGDDGGVAPWRGGTLTFRY